MRIPVVANGEIWTVEDAQRCRAVSGCDALMLGRGAVADPGLARAIRAADAGRADGLEPRQRAGRLKQWLNLLRRRYPEAELAFEHVRTLTDQREITRWIAALQLQAQG